MSGSLLICLIIAVCLFRESLTLNEACTSNGDCKDAKVKCVNNICQCTNCYVQVGSQCEKVDSVALVNTANGMVEGKVKRSVEGVCVQEFLGIPYAQPPLGNLRFANPVPAEPWIDRTYNAYDYGESCYQLEYPAMVNAIGSEDCLYLNIWTPQPRPQKATVMVWFHGGAFTGGSAADPTIDGKVLVSRNDVIFVSMNYRVGALGFLSTGDGRIKGNFGLMDQMLALKWIQSNIEAFGGDPESVTIFGESAGAAAVGYHVLSPVSRGLFKRAIMQSGSPASTWGYMSHETARSRSSQFLQSVGCPDDQSVLQCLQNSAVTPELILQTQTVDFRFLMFSWIPTVDDYLMTNKPSNHLTTNNMKKTELLLGANKDEGNLFLASYGIFLIANLSGLAEAVNTVDFDVPQGSQVDIIEEYSRNLNISGLTAVMNALDEIVGDRSFVCPVVHFANTNVALGLQTYLYSLEYRASNEFMPASWGVAHTADLQWVFGLPMDEARGYTADEVLLSERIMAYWTNFAKYGDPNKAGLLNWPPYNQGNTYLSINGPHSLSGHPFLKQSKCALWKNIDITILSSYK